MNFALLALFIVICFFALFVIIKSIRRKYHGRKAIFLQLLILNLGVFGTFLVWWVIWALIYPGQGVYGLVINGASLLSGCIIISGIADIIGLLLSCKLPTLQIKSNNKVTAVHLDNIFIIGLVIGITAIALWLMFHM